MKKLADKTTFVYVKIPVDLHHRLIQRTAKETADRGRTITPSQVVRWTLEEYLDTWEGAAFVPDQAGRTKRAKKPAGKTTPVHVTVPMELHHRLIQQTAKETAGRCRTVTPSEIVRWAVEEYLDMWEGATFVPDAQDGPASPTAPSGAESAPSAPHGEDSGGAFDGFTVTSDADPGL